MADRRRLTDIAGDFLKVKDWRKFQHYHDRNPSWIKLHKRILDDPEFQRLPDSSKALAIMLWLLASEHNEGLIPWCPDDIAWRLRKSTNDFLESLEILISKGFFVITNKEGQPSSDNLAVMEHPSSTSKRREENINQESKTTAPSVQKRGTRIPDDFEVTDEMREFAVKHGMPDPDTEIEAFKDYWRGVPGPKGCKLDWVATFRNRLRDLKDKRGTGSYVERSKQKQRDGLQSLTRAASEVFGWTDGGGISPLQKQPTNGSGATALPGGLAGNGQGLRCEPVHKSLASGLPEGELLPPASGHRKVD